MPWHSEHGIQVTALERLVTKSAPLPINALYYADLASLTGTEKAKSGLSGDGDSLALIIGLHQYQGRGTRLVSNLASVLIGWQSGGGRCYWYQQD